MLFIAYLVTRQVAVWYVQQDIHAAQKADQRLRESSYPISIPHAFLVTVAGFKPNASILTPVNLISSDLIGECMLVESCSNSMYASVTNPVPA